MTGRQLNLSLLITADASGVRPAAREARTELDAIGASAGAVAAALDRQSAAEQGAARGAEELATASQRTAAANDEIAAATGRAVTVITAQTAAEKLAAAALSGSAAAREQLRLALDAEYAAAKRLDDELGALAAAERMGIEISGGYEAALERLVLKHDAVAAAARRQQQTYQQLAAEGRAAYAADQAQNRINGVLGVRQPVQGSAQASFGAFEAMGLIAPDADRAAKSIGLASYEVQNLTYQLNDMGMMLLSGQAPFMTMLQQGPQVAQIFGRRGLGEIIPALGQALIGLANPTMLFLAGATAAGYAASYAFDALTGEVEDASATMEDHVDLVAAVASRWGDALPALKAYNIELERKRDIEETGRASRDAAREQYADVRDRIPLLQANMADAGITLGQAGADTSAILAFQDAWNLLQEKIEKSNATSEDAIAVQKALTSDTLGVALPAIKAYADQFRELAPLIGEAYDKAEEFRRQQADLVARGNVRRNDYLGGRGADPRTLVEDDYWRDRYFPDLKRSKEPAANVPIPTPRPNLEDALPTARDYLETQREQIAMLELETSLVAASDAVRMRAIASLEAEQEIRRRGIPLYGQEAEELRRNTAAIVERQIALDQAEAARSMLEGQNSRIERSRVELQLIGATVEQRNRVIALLDAEQDMRRRGIDTAGRMAEQIRETAVLAADQATALQRSQDAWKTWTSTVEQSIDGAVDKLLEGDLGGAAEEVLDNVKDVAKELFLTNPLKNLLTGSNYGTASDLLGPLKRFFGGGVTDGSAIVADALGQSTATMNVTAAVVNIGGAGGAAGAGGSILDALGLNKGDLIDTARGTPTPAAVQALDTLTGRRSSFGDMELWKRAISSIESGSFGGNYSAIGPVTRNGDRAYGRFQVMGNNIPSWTRSALGKQLSIRDFLNSPEAQDAVFEKFFGDSVAKHGSPQQAASIWFTGRPISAASMRSADVTGTTGSVYVDKFTRAMERAAGSTDVMTAKVTEAGYGLGNFGEGLNSFGAAMSKGGAPGANSGGGLLGWLGSLFGGSAGGLSGIAGAFNVVSSGGFSGLYDVGGFTGFGDPREAAGIVHRKEYVFSAPAVDAIGVHNLDRMHRAAKSGRGYQDGGAVDVDPWAMPGRQGGGGIRVVNNYHNAAGAEIRTETRQDADGGVVFEHYLDRKIDERVGKPGSGANRTLRSGGWEQPRPQR